MYECVCIRSTCKYPRCYSATLLVARSCVICCLIDNVACLGHLFGTSAGISTPGHNPFTVMDVSSTVSGLAAEYRR